MQKSDFLIIGAGVVGQTIARELKLRYTDQRITVLEKESEPGVHSSGRNSGVLHSGIYYPPETLKARVCQQGATEMAAYHETHKLPLDRRGKILVTTHERDAPQLDLLETRAKQNGIHVERIDGKQLREIEPEARSATSEALWVPSTSVGSPKAMMKQLHQELIDQGIEVRCNARIVSVDQKNSTVTLQNGEKFTFGHAINAAGLHADEVAHLFCCGQRYTLLPFKGIYWKLDPQSGLQFNHLIYPVPDLRVPFLGVHTTTTTDGQVYFGPTAVPAFGRENYWGMSGVEISEVLRITAIVAKQFAQNRDGFRRLAWQEGRHYFKHWFVQAAQAIVPSLEAKFLHPTSKVGIRAQMFDKQESRLVNDFLVEQGHNSTHILNAISPAWTSAFPFARYVCDQYIH
ncbi:MAG: L-2-hydroxyglutarate oxidase [Gammaproteobacteria bacterium]|nr:L-2-hydroxyglutarate oxidase [Gammaproteobacteria bacterium]